ncbi:MAG: GMC family oxidoreductase [Alphaproteobacteria bacterium]|nr:GMC family oxidoreductase [Alphaproteobacteria bacterium]
MPVRDVKPGRHASPDYGGELVVHADVAIVGAGAGGCAAAAAMAEKGLTVALFEEGRHWRPSEFRQGSAFALKHLYQDRGMRSMRGNVLMALPGGRGVGGSTLINSAICFRCPDEILDQWREQHGCSTVTRERFGAYFDRIWETIGVTVQSAEVQRLNNIVFKEGAERLGLQGSFMARSAPGCVGCGICQYGCPTGGKASIDRTFLVEALATGTVGVYADCRIREARTRAGRVTELAGQILHPETQAVLGTVTVRADTFLLSAGPIGTPSFLLSNRLVDDDHCGRHLVVHPTVGALARMPFEVRPWHGVTQGYYVDMWEQGYLLQTYTVTPDQYFALMPTPVGEETMRWMADLRHLASAGALVHDEDSEGRVQITPLGPDISYHLGEGDKRRLIEGLRKTGEVFFAAGATAFLPFRIGGGVVHRPDDIADHLSLDLPATDLQLYASHPMGTCRMSGRAEDGVVDPEGRVWGWDNLRVADASVFPSSLGVNPQVTTMAMGLLVGERIAG